MTCILEAVEIAQWLRLFVVFPEDLNSDRSTHIGWLIVSHNSNARGCDTLFWPLQAPVHTWHIYTAITTTTKTIKSLQIFSSMPSMGHEPPCGCCTLWKGSQCPELIGDSNLCSPHASNLTLRQDFPTLPHGLSGQDWSTDFVSHPWIFRQCESFDFSVVISEHTWRDIF